MKKRFDASSEKAMIAETLLSNAAVLIQSQSKLEIVQSICEAMCGCSAHIRLAWTWFGNPEATEIQPQAYAGSAKAYAEALMIQRNDLTVRGPAFTVLKGGKSAAFRISPNSTFLPWRKAATDYGIRSVLAVPLITCSGDEAGIFIVYADMSDYFDQIGTGLFFALGRLFASVLSSSAEMSKLYETVTQDSMTGVMNRNGLPAIEKRLGRNKVEPSSWYLLIVDIDHFKRVNDEYGHPVGDEVLRSTAQTMRSALRAADDLLRWGGEEFLVCLADTDLAQAQTVAEKLRKAVEAHVTPVRVTISIGVAKILPLEPLNDTILRADKALYEAKRSGRNCIRVAD